MYIACLELSSGTQEGETDIITNIGKEEETEIRRLGIADKIGTMGVSDRCDVR